MNQLLSKTMLYTVGNAASKLISAIIIPIYAFFVTSDALGRYDYALTISGIAAPILYLSVWESVLRFALIANGSDRLRIQSTIAKYVIATTAGIALFSVAICFCFPGEADLLACCALMTATSALAQVWQYFARSSGKGRLFVRSGILGALTDLGLILLLVCLGSMQFLGLGVSYIAAQFLIFVSIEANMRVIPTAMKCRFDKSLLKRALTFSVPLIFNAVASLLLVGFGRLLIVAVLGDYENGLYVFAMRIGSIITVLGSAFSMAAIEEAILRIDGIGLERYFSSLIDGLWKMLLASSAIALPLIHDFYYFIEGTEYESSFQLVPFFVLYAVFVIMSTNYGNAFQIALKTKYAAFTTLAGLVATVALSFATIHRFGIMGVAFSLMVGMSVVMLTRWIAAKRMIRFRTSKTPVLLLLSYVLEAFVLIVHPHMDVVFAIGLTCVSFALFGFPAVRGFVQLRSIEDARARNRDDEHSNDVAGQ